MQTYTIHKQGFKYYIIPNGSRITRLHYPGNFCSFFLKRNAEKFCKELNKAFNAGYIYRVVEG